MGKSSKIEKKLASNGKYYAACFNPLKDQGTKQNGKPSDIPARRRINKAGLGDLSSYFKHYFLPNPGKAKLETQLSSTRFFFLSSQEVLKTNFYIEH